MNQRTVSAKVPEKKDAEGKVTPAMEATVAVNFADSIKEAVEMFGEEACLANMFANWRVTLQGTIRSRLRGGHTPDQIAKDLATAKMGVVSSGGSVDPQQAFIAKFKMSSAEEQAKMLKELKSAAAGKV